jgi:chloride channel protein, CIC family
MGRRNADFFCAVIVVGLLAGVAGLATTTLLRSIEHLTYHYTFGSLLEGVAGSSPVRRALGPVVGGALAGLGWWVLRSRADIPPLSDAIADRTRIRLLPFGFDAALQVLVVGSGASLGREVAPRQFAVALGDFATGWLKRLTDREREILLACAAGAGLGAVYAVPLGGALFTLRIVLKTWHPRAVGAALITSSLAVAVASFVTHDQPNLTWPNIQVSYRLIGYALVLAPLTLGLGLAFNRLMASARHVALTRSWLLIPAIAAAGLLIGVCSRWWPELPGNGKSILSATLAGGMTMETAAIVLVLKPVLTAVFLRAGARGGMLTPALATGAAAGTLLVLIINAGAGTEYHVPAVSMAGAAGVLAITQRAPIWASIFVWELSRPPLWLLLVFLVAASSAYGLLRLVERGRG